MSISALPHLASLPGRAGRVQSRFFFRAAMALGPLGARG